MSALHMLYTQQTISHKMKTAEFTLLTAVGVSSADAALCVLVLMVKSPSCHSEDNIRVATPSVLPPLLFSIELFV